MATDNQLRTYGDASIVQDVLPMIENLTAKENFLLNSLGKTSAISTVHQVQTDTLATPGSLAVAEGGDYTLSARTTPTLRANIVQNIVQPFAVTRTQQKVAHYSGENELVRQTEKALSEWASGAEFDIVRSTLVSGASGTIAKMSGIIEAISKSTNTTAHTSGTVFSASILKGLMKGVWDNGNGAVVTDVFMGSYLKTVFDGFTAGSTKYMDADSRVVYDTASVFEGGAFGRVFVHTHRYVQQSGDTTGRILGINRDKIKIAYLERPYIDTGLGRDGDYDKRAVVGKLTVEVRNQDSNFFSNGFALA